MVEGPRAVDAALDRGARFEAVYLGPARRRRVRAAGRRGSRAAGVAVATLKEGVLEKVGTTRHARSRCSRSRRMPATVAPTCSAADGLVRGRRRAVRSRATSARSLRSAEAAGAAAIVLGPGSVDAYNPKVVRASAGAIFGVPVVDARRGGRRWRRSTRWARRGRQRLGATRRRRHALRPRSTSRVPTAVVLGNEAHGLARRRSTRALDGRVTIPMAGPAESLNVAMAGTVLCFESARQRAALAAGAMSSV